MKKIAISKAIAVKDWKGTSLSLWAFLWNASMAGAPRTEHREVCPQCCNTEWATLRFAEPLSEDELSPETEAGPMVQKIRESNHLVCNYKDLPAPNCFWAFCLPSRRVRNTLGFMFKSCWRRWNTCKHVVQWSTEAIFFWALEISKWDKFLNQPACFLVVIVVDYSLRSCYWNWGHRPTGQRMTHKYRTTCASAPLMEITPYVTIEDI